MHAEEAKTYYVNKLIKYRNISNRFHINIDMESTNTQFVKMKKLNVTI